MKSIFFIFTLLFFLVEQVLAYTSYEAQSEMERSLVKENLSKGGLRLKKKYPKDLKDRLFVFSLWSSYQDEKQLDFPRKKLSQIRELYITDYPHYLALRLGFLKLHFGYALTQEEIQYLYDGKEWTQESMETLGSLRDEFAGENYLTDILSRKSLRKKRLRKRRRWSQKDLKRMIFFTPKWRLFRNNKYRKVPRLYLFCRHQRKFPCLMIMRNKEGKLVRDKKGRVWSQPKLAKSRRGYSYNKLNGNTPQGVYKIESVMPKADNQLLYGRYRRLVLDLVERSSREKKIKHYLPKFVHSDSWWREGVVARNIGRTLFRIHGVGRPSLNPLAEYYPFVPTSGCVASLEGNYNGIDYRDQRHLLDQFMGAMNLEPRYKNETKLRGMLYVINIDNEQRKVELRDIFK